MTLQKIAIIVSVLLFNYSGSSQNKNTYTTEAKNNIYNNSLNLFLETLEESILSQKEKDTVVFNEMNAFFKDMHILKSEYTSNHLLNQNNKRIKFLQDESELKKLLNNNSPQKVLKIVPLRNDKDIFFVNIIIYNAYFANGVIELANLTGASIEYKFDCDLNGLLVLTSNPATHSYESN